ncbi:MAG TPA: AAA family ATPase [Candidatus Limiplasma sp.]|nr:AAA family ATPase [Candidatus Limiplasma sp.]
MIYLDVFEFPDAERETSFICDVRRTCYDSFYPFKVLSQHGFARIDFEPVTILYGGNGSGKTTALNVIAERLGVRRETIYNRSNFFPDYVDMCRMELRAAVPGNSRIITSDDVFDYMLNIRSLNEGIIQKRENLFEEYLEAKYSDFQLKSMADYEKLKKVNASRSKTQSKYVRETLMDNVRELSNGESAHKYFVEKIEEDGLYLLDEPENSLSPARQLELKQYIEDSARFFGCQFILSTHSPFMLSMRGAKIYDLDADPVDIKRWTELTTVRAYYDFFKEHEREF